MPEICAEAIFAIFSSLSPSALKRVTLTDEEPALMDKMTVDLAMIFNGSVSSQSPDLFFLPCRGQLN